MLIFDEVVSWACGRLIKIEGSIDVEDDAARASESTGWPYQRPHLGVPMGIMALIPEHPSLGRWGMIIEQYSSRNLTWEGDIIRAFAGATEVMSKTFPGGVNQGLPVFFFDIALLWQPEEELQRRQGQPSWSWTGWKGRVDCLNAWLPFFAGVYRHSGSYMDWTPIAPLKPLVTWSRGTSKAEEYCFHYEHFNGFYDYQAMRSLDDAKLPSGWTRHFHQNGDYFTDANFVELGRQFSYPLPTTKNIQPIHVEKLPPVLCFTAPTATLTCGKNLALDSSIPGVFSLTRPFTHGAATWEEMSRASGGWTKCHEVVVGSLVVHSLLDVRAEGCQDCELVAISEGQLDDLERASKHNLLGLYMESQGWFREERLEIPDDIEDRKFYNVLWVVREGEISYRKGLGMVSRRLWDALGATVESIKLG